MTPIEMRNIIDQLIQQYGFNKVNKTIQSILDFYAEIEPEDDEAPDTICLQNKGIKIHNLLV